MIYTNKNWHLAVFVHAQLYYLIGWTSSASSWWRSTKTWIGYFIIATFAQALWRLYWVNFTPNLLVNLNISSLCHCDFYVAPLLTNYRCHETILRLPSALFYESTLQPRSTSKLHPSCISAIEFVCTSLDQTILHNCPDYDDTEVKILLEQVRFCMHAFFQGTLNDCERYNL